MSSELRVGTDASGGACWEVEINGVWHRSRSAGVLRELMAGSLNQKPTPTPYGRWALLEPIEGLCFCRNSAGCDRCQFPSEPIDL